MTQPSDPEQQSGHKGFRFSIDRGGTFTDVYAETPDGGIRVVKLLSEDPGNYPDAPREGIRRVLSEFRGKEIPPDEIDETGIEWIRMGTTVATNALLERKGERHVLLVTRGFGDILRIGNQTRPDIFDLVIKKPSLVYDRVIEVDERIRPFQESDIKASPELVQTTMGDKFVRLSRPDPEKVRRDLQTAFDDGIRSVAVVFMHAYCFPEHELLVGEMAEEMGFTQISLSHRVMPMVKIVSRGDTTTVDAYLTPHIQKYLRSFRSGFRDELQHTPLLFMQSDGGLVSADRFKGSNAILSGPAGGVVGYAMTTYSRHEKKPVIGFDMGGTSTDVSRFGGEFELVHETETAGVRIQAPQMNIVTVAAGGGSRLFFRNGLFEVGPESAGAHPGPVCYRKNGYPAVTDANLVLGRLQPDYFPKVFGETLDQPLDIAAAREELNRLTHTINRTCGRSLEKDLTVEEVALGFIRVANETMIRSIREISVMRGYDVEEHVLACFGGAGGQHACAIARELGIKRILIHRYAGVLSAYGMGLADVVVERQEPSTVLLAPGGMDIIKKRLSDLAQSARTQLSRQGYDGQEAVVTAYLNLRYQGTDTAFMIPTPDDNDYESSFRSSHLREFGFDLEDRNIVVDDIRIRAVYRSPGYKAEKKVFTAAHAEPETTVACYFESGWEETPIYRLDHLGQKQRIEGPAIIIQDTATILIEPGCRAEMTDEGNIGIDIVKGADSRVDDKVDPVQLSIFGHLFMSIAEQMGRTLQKTAISTNIKERLDFSCALFDQNGQLVANAPHVPVHLGAMGETVRWQMAHAGNDLREGDVLVTNHPSAGGSHLPDITVITPVWHDGKPVMTVANRGHHADIGGISPGSMSPFSKLLIEEGACIKSFKLVAKGRFDEKGITERLFAPGKIKRKSGRPVISGTRAIDDNVSDLKAQVAANLQGVELLRQMIDRYDLFVVHRFMKHIQLNAEQAVREMLRNFSKKMHLLPVDTVLAEDFLDDGSPIRLGLTIDRDEGSAIFDFSGSGPELWGNLNTPKAVVSSAVLYSLRSILKQRIPLNSGCLKPVRLVVPEGTLLSPSENAAVVGGNVLTSQRITDVVFRAFQTVAASQGCMNNLTFGNDHMGYYETIGGGAGAGPHWDGQSGVHTHMTNTRITDPEILEKRYPVMLRRFSLRPDSGGKGKYSGGDGLIREIEFLDYLNVAILSERRVFAPYGLAGGKPGKQGKNLFLTRDGRTLNLGGKNEIRAEPGDAIRIATPGGGGYGIAMDGNKK
ncbi:hydantoinase/oxoprolinase [delta proteobacterium NaphS2]|nr:hydantoinase/oxoprolinase [delta proteobacterium NaphS2]